MTESNAQPEEVTGLETAGSSPAEVLDEAGTQVAAEVPAAGAEKDAGSGAESSVEAVDSPGTKTESAGSRSASEGPVRSGPSDPGDSGQADPAVPVGSGWSGRSSVSWPGPAGSSVDFGSAGSAATESISAGSVSATYAARSAASAWPLSSGSGTSDAVSAVYAARSAASANALANPSGESGPGLDVATGSVGIAEPSQLDPATESVQPAAAGPEAAATVEVAEEAPKRKLTWLERLGLKPAPDEPSGLVATPDPIAEAEPGTHGESASGQGALGAGLAGAGAAAGLAGAGAQAPGVASAASPWGRPVSIAAGAAAVAGGAEAVAASSDEDAADATDQGVGVATGQPGDAMPGSALADDGGPHTAVLPAVAPGVVPVAPVPPVDAGTGLPPKPKPGVARRTRKARLRLARLDPWSVMKTSFLFSIAAGIMLVVAVYVVWMVLATSGLFDSVNEIVADVVSTPGDTTPFRIEEYISTQKVMGVTALLACVDVIIFTAFATLGSFLYNLSATMLGGLEVTLAED